MGGNREQVQDAFYGIEDYLNGLPKDAVWQGPGGKAVLLDSGQSLGLTTKPGPLQYFVTAFRNWQKTLPVEDFGGTSMQRPLSAAAYQAASSRYGPVKSLQDWVNASFEQISSAMGQMGRGAIGTDDSGYRALVSLLRRSIDRTPIRWPMR